MAAISYQCGGWWKRWRRDRYDDASLLDREGPGTVSSVSVTDDSSDTWYLGPYPLGERGAYPYPRGGLGSSESHTTPRAIPGATSSVPLLMSQRGPVLEREIAAPGERVGTHNLWAGVPMEAGVGRGWRIALADQGTLGDHGMGDRIYTGPAGLEAEGVIDRIGAQSGAQPYLGGWGRQGWEKGCWIAQGGCTLSQPKFGQ